MSHRYHPDSSDEYNDDTEAILFDECDDCERHSHGLGLTLDQRNWWAMWVRMLAVEIEETEAYRSTNEANLGRQMYYVYVALERHTRIVDPSLRSLAKLPRRPFY